MSQELLNSVEKNSVKAVQDIKTGYTVKVHQKIKEGEKERIQIFEGLVIAVNGPQGPNRTITVRRIVSGVGVEKIFPVNSSTIEKFEIVKTAKIRRAKLYYMRERSGKSAKLKEQHITADHELNKLPVIEETEVQETPQPEIANEVSETGKSETPETQE